jgi:hypothetical protein
MALQPDYRDILAAFAEYQVKYLVIGGYAVGFHGTPRFTKDLDLWIGPGADNIERVRQALLAFGAPKSIVDQLETASERDVLWMGIPPVRIDILKGVPGGDFTCAYRERVVANWDGVQVQVVNRFDLIKLKRASGRPQDLLDADALEKRVVKGG